MIERPDVRFHPLVSITAQRDRLRVGLDRRVLALAGRDRVIHARIANLAARVARVVQDRSAVFDGELLPGRLAFVFREENRHVWLERTERLIDRDIFFPSLLASIDFEVRDGWRL